MNLRPHIVDLVTVLAATRTKIVFAESCTAGLVAASLAAGLMASGDVPATLPVIPPGVTTVGTRLFGLLHSGARYQEAALAIWYIAAVVAICLFWLRQGVASRGRVV